MKNLIKECIVAMALIVLTLVLICCASKPKEVVKEIPVPVVMGLEGVYFPSFPYPKDGIIQPLTEADKDGELHVYAVVIPYWYWNLIIDYASKTETAVTALEAVNSPEAKKPP